MKFSNNHSTLIAWRKHLYSKSCFLFVWILSQRWNGLCLLINNSQKAFFLFISRLGLLPSNFKDISEAFLGTSAEFLFGKKNKLLLT